MMDVVKIAVLLLLPCVMLAEGLEIHRVVPSKIIYRPNEDGAVELVVGNSGKTPQKALARLSTRWDMDGAHKLGEREVALVPGEVKSLVFPWNSGAERFGREIRAELIQDGKAIAMRAEYFNVIREWWRVDICGDGDGGLCGSFSKENNLSALRRKVLAYYHLPFVAYEYGQPPQKEIGPFLGYGNHAMLYASTPSVFGALVPENVPEGITWYSGSGLYAETTKKMRADQAWRKKWGAKATMYSFPSFTGPCGFEIARRHPEWVARTETGAFAESGFASPSPLELANPITTQMSGWFGLMPDLYNAEALRFGDDALVKTIREFGWDGIFWDGCGYVVGPSYSYRGDAMPNGQDPEEVSACNIKRTNEAIWKEFPDAFLWYNGANPADVGSFYPSGNGGGRKGKMQMVADPRGGSLKELQWFQIVDPRHAAHSWRSLFDIYLDARDSIRKRNWGRPLKGDNLHSGFLYSETRYQISQEDYAKTREDWAWSNHAISLIAAAQLHFCGGGTAFRPMLQLMTRYSKFFWDEDIHIVDKAYKHVELDSLREVWWEDAVYERKTAAGKDIILNLVNSPDSETADMKIYADPHPADDVELTFLDVKDAAGVKAWAVRPYDYESPTLAPVQAELKPELIEGHLVVAVPPFRYFSLVVVRLPEDRR